MTTTIAAKPRRPKPISHGGRAILPAPAWPRLYRHLQTRAGARPPLLQAMSFPAPAVRLASCLWCRCFVFSRRVRKVGTGIIDVGRRRRAKLVKMIKHGWIVDQGFTRSGRDHVCPVKHPHTGRIITPVWPA